MTKKPQEEIYAAIINQYYDAFEDFKKTMQEKKLDRNKQIDLFLVIWTFRYRNCKILIKFSFKIKR